MIEKAIRTICNRVHFGTKHVGVGIPALVFIEMSQKLRSVGWMLEYMNKCQTEIEFESIGIIIGGPISGSYWTCLCSNIVNISLTTSSVGYKQKLSKEKKRFFLYASSAYTLANL